MTKNNIKTKAKYFDDYDAEDNETFSKGRKKNKINIRNMRKEVNKTQYNTEGYSDV